jgi:hypothetical protein
MHRRLVTAVALVASVISCGGALGKGDKRGAQVTSPVDLKKAATQLGHPGETFEQISPYHLPEIYWIRIGSGPNAIGGPFIVRDGELVLSKGYATGSAWLRRAVFPLKTAPNADYVASVLAAYETLPLGWSSAGVHGVDEQTGERGGLKLHPFELKLIWGEYVRTQSRLPKPLPKGGPGEPPGDAPEPPGGYAPPTPCRAVLKELDGKLTWIVERYFGGEAGWQLLLKEPIE